MSKHLVIVESPAKAKTIQKYLGNDYEVVASYGHVRDLPARKGSVNPDKHFAMTYVPIEKIQGILKRLQKCSKNQIHYYWQRTLIAKAKPFPGIFMN